MDKSVELYRDGTLVGTFKDDGSAMAYIHRMHPYSFSHAIAHEGYSMRTTTEAEAPRRRLLTAGRIPARSSITTTGETK